MTAGKEVTPKDVDAAERLETCRLCGDRFVKTTSRKIYCGRGCAVKAMNRKHYQKVIHEPRQCKSCPTVFMPARSDSWFCGQRCRRRAEYSYTPKDNTRSCAICGAVFRPVRNDAEACNRGCSKRLSYLRYRKKRIAESVEWNRNSPKRKAICDKHKARRRASTGDVFDFDCADWARAQARFNYMCAYCGAGGDMTMDHVVPLSRGGNHGVGNIVPACISCNASKQDKFLVEWRQFLANRSRLIDMP